MIRPNLKQFYFNCNINQNTDLHIQLFSIVLCINSVNVDDANEVSVVVSIAVICEKARLDAILIQLLL